MKNLGLKGISHKLKPVFIIKRLSGSYESVKKNLDYCATYVQDGCLEPYFVMCVGSSVAANWIMKLIQNLHPCLNIKIIITCESLFMWCLSKVWAMNFLITLHNLPDTWTINNFKTKLLIKILWTIEICNNLI